MKFIADAMLGRLARWLRFLGFDVLHSPDIEDRRVINISREQERTVLTRDTLLLKQKGLKDPVFISSDDVFEQLCEIREILDFQYAEPSGRCSACNGMLLNIPHKDAVKDLVPEFIYHNFDDFIQCMQCKKVYWKGTHYSNIRGKTRELMKVKIEE